MADEQQIGELPSKPPLWTDPKFRAIVFQIIISIAIALFIVYIVRNTLHNMDQRGIATGFGFLSNEAGFGVLQSLIPYDETYTYGRTFLVGLLNTLLVSVLGVFFATLLGFIMGVARLSTNWLIARIAATYIEIFRNIPLLLQIFFWYFAVGINLPHPRQSIALSDVAGRSYSDSRGDHTGQMGT